MNPPVWRWILWMLAWTGVWPFYACAQREQVWAFGVAGGLDFNSPGGPAPVATAISGFGEGCASVCDKNGALLFYTEGSFIWDRNGNLMPNGNELPGFVSTVSGGNVTTSSTTQGAVIVPVPDSSGKYYVFSLTAGESRFPGRLYCSVVDMSRNSGYGDVVPGRKGVLLDSGLTEKMTAVAGERCNIWLLVYSKQTASCHAWEITDQGIAPAPVVSNCGTLNGNLYGSGVMKIAPDRKKLVTCNTGGGLEIYDFDPVGGIVSNTQLLDYGTYYGAAFSPDNSKLYVTVYNDGTLFQFDLDAPRPALAKTWLGSSSGMMSDIKQGPDGRLYLGGNATNLSVIGAPDLPGLSCGFAFRSVPLDPGARMTLGLPNVVVELKRDTITTRREQTACFSDRMLLTAADTSGWDYTWDDGTGGHTRTVSSGRQYVLHYHTPPCVWHTDTFEVKIFHHIPETGVFTGCRDTGSYAWVRPGQGDTTVYNYTWREQGGQTLRTYAGRDADTLYAQAGRYTVRMLGSNGCDTTLEIIIPEAVYRVSFNVDTLTCAGVPLSFQNTSTGNFTAYQWDLGDGNTGTVQHPQHTYAGAGVYIVRLTGVTDILCRDTVYRRIRVDTAVSASFTKDRDSICAGAGIYFYPSYSSRADSVLWQFGNSRFVPADTGDIYYSWDEDGLFQVTLTAYYADCPVSLFTDTVRVFPYPVVDLGPDTILCPGMASLRLANRIAAWPEESYVWNTGARTPVLPVTVPGVYALTVTSAYGCAVTDSIEIERSCYIEIPNVFSPDGNGINDYFFPKDLTASGLSAFHMRIYNRWGQQIFESKSVEGQGWNGQYNGQPQSQGVYVYRIELSFVNGRTEQYKGNVTLLR